MKQDIERLKFLLSVGEKEQKHLNHTTHNLKAENIDELWVKALEGNYVLSERLDAFVARFGRFQDHLGDKLIPELIKLMLEKPSSALDNLNRMEKLGVLRSVDEWVKVRWLRNKLIHEYVVDSAEFALALKQAIQAVELLNKTADSLREYAQRFFVEDYN